MQAFCESTGLPPVAFCLDRVYPNGTGSNGAWYASSPDAAWSENAWDGEDRERPKVSVSPAKLTTFFLGPFFSSCARALGRRTLANPRGIGHCQIQMNGESTVDRRGLWSGPAVGLAMPLRRAWSVETGISHLLSTSWMWFCRGWICRRMVPPHRVLIGLWRICSGRRRPERAARQGFWGTNK